MKETNEIGSFRQCPKCGLEAKTLLHRFCKHADCPVRDWERSKKEAVLIEPPRELSAAENAAMERDVVHAKEAAQLRVRIASLEKQLAARLEGEKTAQERIKELETALKQLIFLAKAQIVDGIDYAADLPDAIRAGEAALARSNPTAEEGK